MLIGIDVAFRVSYYIISYVYVSFSGLITSVGEKRAHFSAIAYLTVIMWFLFGRVSSFSWCLG